MMVMVVNTIEGLNVPNLEGMSSRLHPWGAHGRSAANWPLSFWTRAIPGIAVGSSELPWREPWEDSRGIHAWSGWISRG